MNTTTRAPQKQVPFNPTRITRPAPVLLTFYLLAALLTGPLFLITFPPLLCRYMTLRYKFDDTGVSMSWGVLFRREIHLTYRRIQDIHLSRHIIQRWLGLATVAIQTASGSSSPEMKIEGILEADQLRDFLYNKMRGAKGDDVAGAAASGDAPPADESLALLHEIRDLLRRISEQRSAQS